MQGNPLQQRCKKNTFNLAIWTVAWLLSLALAQFGPLLIWQHKGLTIGAFILNLVLGIGMLLANRKHLLGQDELQQKIQLEAMAFTLGAGLIAGILYEVAENIQLIQFNAEISHLVIFMGLTYIAATLLGQRRYQ
ncbi:hypothetical protein [Lacimicrobium alkaliphilum]|uniref:Uncharacterized protein n=1 Tax=Lacimicrobium alkaliphilum TaxID=1526571 RepID=A0ABQ1RIY6_9ALTE|nr:hypothetical protein [Lacimicrobium alkaliphilum]GGD68582.1 hypothetical protein GCM10011357_24550 [Lacimicrobium alkaliphilum]